MTRTVLITGGAYGIGRAIAKDFSADHNLVVTWHKTPPEAILSEAPGVLAIQANLTDESAPQRVIDAVIDHFGQLDVIVNNAGAKTATPLDSFDAAAHRAILDLNLLTPAALLAAALPHLSPGAAVISITSVNAIFPPRGAATYGASKAALNLWTRAMAKELGPRGIRVNGVAPGATNVPENPRPDELTELFVKDTALGRLARAEDIAQAVRFLSSNAARSITGEILNVSGGYRL
ncbi:SDR family NAD(P)-dependent oxidoreductase [Parasedimentitalea psychrophila]|uniref:SDR family oxidoreductase n=1 Tax=Parasedimentitalea psychrophila TaxID=2997337 RepID=A0A9Y2KWI5_9RHOB|nr:SDR family oxidoreductase [Parasedimentitalea psychrophila]WIY23605.1 SDR family oxidoreductase [Parasedimentitalea psychrophila]